MGVFDRIQASKLVQANMGAMLAHARTLEPFTINGYSYTGEHLLALLVIQLEHLDVQMAEIGAWIGHWGQLTAAAKKAHDKDQAAYRAMRDKFVTAAGATADDADVEDGGTKGKKAPKPKAKSKTAAEAEWRTRDDYVQIYERQADLEYAWSCAQYVYEALCSKRNMLTALGKLYADEHSATTGAGIPNQPR